ncbi:patj homolog [Panulirus ornatus]|uniref:patj homolog n=1 Tax=Panulirus ornatus TaxID=150431 RepID=UPI003A85D349
MPLSSGTMTSGSGIPGDTSAALSLLERIQRAMKESDDIKMSDQCSNDLNTLISVLESPVFRGIINIQVSTVMPGTRARRRSTRGVYQGRAM